jgi:hypothetical protein
MRKIAVSVLCFLFSVPVFAGIVVKPFGGYTTVSMAHVNSVLDGLYDSPTFDGLKKSRISFRDAYLAGLDLGYSFIPGLDVCLRGEYIGAYSELKGKNPSPPPDDFIYSFPADIIPVLAGVSYSYNFSGSPFSIGAEAYAGYGFAHLALTQTEDAFDGVYSVKYTAPTYGGGFVLDSAIKFGYAISSMINLNLTAGYRQAKVSYVKSLKDTTSGSMFSFTKDEVIKGPDDKDLNLDFGGLILNIALGLNF